MRYHHPPTATGYPLDKEIDNHKRNHYKRRKREQTMSMNNMEPGNSFMTPKEDVIETGGLTVLTVLTVLIVLILQTVPTR